MPEIADCPVLARVREVADRLPQESAVVHDGVSWSYERLAERVEWWAGHVRGLGLAPGTPVAVVSPASPELPAAFLGVRAAGLVPALLDARQPRSRLEAALEAAAPGAVLRLPGSRPEIPSRPARPPLPPGAGYLAFSSGSQGSPKGVMGSAAGLAHFLRWEAGLVGAGPGLRTAALTSPSFDVVLRDLFLPLTSGATLHVPRDTVRASARLTLPWLAEAGIGLIHAVPSVAARWLRAGPARLPGLRWTLFAGEPLTAAQVARWRETAPHARVVNLYGPTETTLATFAWEVPADPPARPGPLPVGRPITGARFGLEPVDGQPGTRRIVIDTPHGSLGYLPGTAGAADRARLRRQDGRTRFETQDRGQLDDDGALVVLGRLDSMVKRNGVFVDTAAIEAAAVAHPAVDAACCLQDPTTTRLRVVVVDGGGLDPADLLTSLRARLGTGAPDQVVVTESLPRLPSGKIDRIKVGELR